MTEKTLPAMTAEDFEMRWDEDHTFPFTENEDATIMAHGHHDREAFARQVCEYDKLVAGSDFYDEPMDGSDVQHLWAVRLDRGHEEDGWMIQWGGVTENTPNAFPVTVILR